MLQGTHLTLETRGLFNHFLLGDCGALKLSGFDKILAVYLKHTHTNIFFGLFVSFSSEGRRKRWVLGCHLETSFYYVIFSIKSSGEQLANRNWPTEITWLPGT